MGIEPESGFKPIVEGQGSSIPTLAFSVLDGAERPPVSADIYQSEPKLEDYYYYYEVCLKIFLHHPSLCNCVLLGL